MKVQLSVNYTFPWEQCELCYVGPAVLNSGDSVVVYLSLFLIEFGIHFIKS